MSLYSCNVIITPKLLIWPGVIFFHQEVAACFHFLLLLHKTHAMSYGPACSWAHLSLQYCSFTAGRVTKSHWAMREKYSHSIASFSVAHAHMHINLKVKSFHGNIRSWDWFSFAQSQSPLPSFLWAQQLHRTADLTDFTLCNGSYRIQPAQRSQIELCCFERLQNIRQWHHLSINTRLAVVSTYSTMTSPAFQKPFAPWSLKNNGICSTLSGIFHWTGQQHGEKHNRGKFCMTWQGRGDPDVTVRRTLHFFLWNPVLHSHDRSASSDVSGKRLHPWTKLTC